MEKVLQNSTENKVVFIILNEDELPWVDLDHTADGLEFWCCRKGGSDTQIIPSSSNFREKKNGLYELDIPDNIYTVLGSLYFTGAITDGFIIGEKVEVVEKALATSDQSEEIISNSEELIAASEELKEFSEELLDRLNEDRAEGLDLLPLLNKLDVTGEIAHSDDADRYKAEIPQPEPNPNIGGF